MIYTPSGQRKFAGKKKRKKIPRKIKRAIRERANDCCEGCNTEIDFQIARSFEYHHIFPVKYFPGRQHEKQYILLLCKKCHNKIHSLPPRQSFH